MTIPKITPYTGGVANPDGSQTQTEFTQNMFDQLSYEANLSTELNNTVDVINDTAIQVDSDAVSASQSAAAAEAAVSGLDYQGLWPDTGGSANKGETYQTQTGGTPTGQYFTALQNTIVDPVSDDVNWRFVLNDQSVGSLVSYQAASVSGMTQGLTWNLNQVTLAIGQRWSTGGTDWFFEDATGPITPDNFRAFDVINVFDAEFDGTGDIGPAIVRATSYNGSVFIPDGIFDLSTEIPIASGNKYFGVKGKTTLRQSDNANLQNLFTGASISDVGFTDISIDINPANQSSYVDGQQPNLGRGFLFTSCSELRFDNVEVLDLFGHACFAIECSDIRFSHGRLTDTVGRFSSFGLYFVRSNDILVESSKFFGTQNFGVGYTTFMVYARDTCSDVTVISNEFSLAQCFFEGKTTGGAESFGSNYKLIGNTFEQPPADIATSFCKRGSIYGNTVRKSGDFGISIGDSEGVVATANVVQESNTVGMSLRKCTGCTIANNIIKDPCTNWRGFTLVENQRVGIYVIGDSVRNNITNNVITDFQTSPNKMYSAIRIEDFAAGVKGDDSSWAIISGNICLGGYSGIDIYSDGADNILGLNYTPSDGVSSIRLGNEPQYTRKEGDFRNNTILKKPTYYDGSQECAIPKVVPTPANSSSPGKTGDVAFNSSYFYVCNSENSWRRVALETF